MRNALNFSLVMNEIKFLFSQEQLPFTQIQIKIFYTKPGKILMKYLARCEPEKLKPYNLNHQSLALQFFFLAQLHSKIITHDLEAIATRQPFVMISHAPEKVTQ